MFPQQPLDPTIAVTALLAWIEHARRDLPWRRRRDPYTVWVSEIMLQQTRAATVIPYFERWMAQFGHVETLATAPVANVLKAWEGLGYYARARNLHRAAQQVMAQHGGRLPSDRQALLALPGIGSYTAGAILSLAYGQTEPVLDGNVRRVLCRVYDIAEEPRESHVEKRLWGLARDLVEKASPDRAGDLNEALMELGALVCTPGVPDCPTCPLVGFCQAHATGIELERPVKMKRGRTPHHDVTAAIIQDKDTGRYMIIQRRLDGLLGGMWGFPGGFAFNREPLPLSLERAARDLVGIEIAVGEPVVHIKHAYTHLRITLHVYNCRMLSGAAQPLGYADLRWVLPEELPDYPFPVTDQKILRALGLHHL